MPGTIVNITTTAAPVTVDVTAPPAVPVTVDATPAATAVAVAVNLPAPAAIAVTLQPPCGPVAVAVQEARDAYQLALAEGFTGTRQEWLASLVGQPGPAGANAQIVVLTLAAYLALAPATQTDGRWYLIPKT